MKSELTLRTGNRLGRSRDLSLEVAHLVLRGKREIVILYATKLEESITRTVESIERMLDRIGQGELWNIRRSRDRIILERVVMQCARG